jgi:hypothetical protein
MRATLLTVTLVAVAVLALEKGCNRSSAPLSTPMATAITEPSIVQKVVAVCGNHGCVQVQTKRIIHHQKPGNTAPHRI